MQKIVVIVGPTASGKSALAVELARAIGGEIVSADSRQVYKGLNIGTGKITRREMKGVRHHLLDICSARRTFTAHDFAVRAHKTIADIARRGKVPIVAGGTGFYIDILTGRIDPAPVPRNKHVRARLEKKTTRQLFALLRRRDQRRAEDINAKNERNNRHRLIRALEISYAPGARRIDSPRYKVTWIGIKPDLRELKVKIRKRLIDRLRKGMIAEARRLHTRGLSYKRMDGLGLEYRSLALHLQGAVTKQELVEQLAVKIWHYARRQITYWKRNKDINWYTPQELKNKKAAMIAAL